ncbi:MAG: hypothetical protein FGM25_12045, partial [Mycobacterium sp.]|nr:hypothetical protein [Mycobacterium sp.]
MNSVQQAGEVSGGPASAPAGVAAPQAGSAAPVASPAAAPAGELDAAVAPLSGSLPGVPAQSALAWTVAAAA